MSSGLFYGSLLSFTVGVGIGTFFDLHHTVALWLLCLGFAIAVLRWLKGSVINQELVYRKNDPILFFIVCLVFLSFGIVRAEVASWQFGVSSLEARVGEEVSLRGVVASEPVESERSIQFHLKTDTDMVLVSTDRLSVVGYGDVVEVEGKVEHPGTFETELGRTFNYEGYLKARGVEYRVSFAEVVVAGSGEGNPIVRALLRVKQGFLNTLQRVLPEPASGLGAGLLLGVKSALGDELEEDFRRAGIIHIVVLSGYNIMLVVAFILFVFSYFLGLRARLLASVAAIVLFALLIGPSATVVRASIMASLVLIAKWLGRGYNVLRALCFAGAVMLFVDPYLLLYDVGFQLSFMATLGLVLFLPQLEATSSKEGRSIGWQTFILSTLATQIAVLPLLIYHIGEVSLIALVVNVLVLPVVPLAMLLTFLTGLGGLLSTAVAGVVGYLDTWILNYIVVIASWFAGLPFAVVSVPVLPVWGVFGLYGIMFISWLGWYRFQLRKGVYDGWTIVLEDEMGVHAAAGRSPAAVETNRELPVFFR